MSLSEIRFSIATPTRNALDKLKRCVGSVRGQHEVTREHLIQDAQSTDGTPDWLAGQAGILGRSEADGGMYDAINRAWARSRGEFLSWLNSDEQYLPGTLAKVGRYFDNHPNVDVVFGDYIVTDSSGNPVALRREIPFRRFYVKNTFLNAQSCTLFFRRRLLERGMLVLNDKYRYAADKELMLRLCESGVTIEHIPDYLSIFGIDGTNLSTHAAALDESESIRQDFGAFRFRPFRSIAVLGRRAERLLRGCYKKESVRFMYVLDESTNAIEVNASEIGGRYSLADNA